MGHFTPETFDFLFDLDVNNDRAWFEEHRVAFERHVKQPMLAFISDLAEPLHERVSPQLLAIPKMQGGSMFRIHRDTRFSHDDRPFKSNAGAQFRHAAASDDVHAPGLYLHLEPGNCFMGGGVYRPPTRVLNRLRDRMVAAPEEWVRTRDRLLGTGVDLGGEQLRTKPRGYDADHPLIDDLRRTSLVFSRSFPEELACADDFLDTFVGWGEAAEPFLAWVCDGLDVPW
jgi:uncharacterized protein (TIGR02453 family)